MMLHTQMKQIALIVVTMPKACQEAVCLKEPQRKEQR